MRLIDTHCHLTHSKLAGGIEQVLQRAADAGVIACICASADVDESRQSQLLARRFEQVYFTAGVHPHGAKEVSADYLLELEALAADPKNVAIGEIGLDYHYNFSPPPQQQTVFAQQLGLAKRLGKIAVIHTREAFVDTMAILRKSGIPGQRVAFHSFTENAQALTEAIEFGAMVGFSGIVTFKNGQRLRDAALLMPPDRMLVETDAPWLSPEPVRSVKDNAPANVAHVAACLAQLHNMQPAELADLTTANAIRFFGLTLLGK